MARDVFRMRLARGAVSLGVNLEEEQLQRLVAYKNLLLEWNRKLNLTSVVEESDIAAVHFLDSLSGLSLSIPEASYLVDVGSGAGFPGLVLKIVRPDIELCMIEATAKKAAFLARVVEVLGLADATVLVMRAETAGHDHRFRETFDFAVARAVSSLPALLEYALPLLRPGGRFIAYKGDIAADERRKAEKAAALLGGRIEGVVRPVIPFLKAERSLIVIEKKAPTDPRYPRRPGIPAKRPLGA